MNTDKAREMLTPHGFHTHDGTKVIHAHGGGRFFGTTKLALDAFYADKSLTGARIADLGEVHIYTGLVSKGHPDSHDSVIVFIKHRDVDEAIAALHRRVFLEDE